MTVCTASIFAWNYDLKKEGGDWGFAIAAAADRMLTDVGLGIEYEGSRWKGVGLGNKQVVLVAGDMAVHSEILRRLNQDLQTNPLESTHDTAERVAKLFREYRAEEAARQYLAPLSLDNVTFVEGQKLMDTALVRELAREMQNYSLQTEAIVLGVDRKDVASLYRVDQNGIVSNHSDTGFVSIGEGGIHSSAYFMLTPYTHTSGYYQALYHTFKAKKRAEVAPGVGAHTDMFLINAINAVTVDRPVIEGLEKLHADDIARAKKRPDQAGKQLFKLHNTIFPQQSSGTPPSGPTAPRPQSPRPTRGGQ
jgi:hypothetical protein